MLLSKDEKLTKYIDTYTYINEETCEIVAVYLAIMDWSISLIQHDESGQKLH